MLLIGNQLVEWVLLPMLLSFVLYPPPGNHGQLEAAKPARDRQVPKAAEIRFIDDSTLKLTVHDPQIELQTPYGKLLIPFADIQRLDLGLRISAEEARKIEAQMAKLGSPRFREREAASHELLTLGHKAYPALLRLKSSDAEVVHRVEQSLEKIREAVAADLLEMPDHDVVYTQNSQITGKITASAFKVRTFQFGELELKLADVRSLRSIDAPATTEAGTKVLPDPGNLQAYQEQVGKSFRFRVTGAAAGSVWGTGIYTADSVLAAASVHAGVLRPGQTGIVRVKVVKSPAAFQGSTQNGVASAAYGPYQGAYEVSR